MTADMTALALLFLSHREQLRAFLSGKGVSPQDINDLMQDVCARFLEVKNQAAISEPVRYLFGIAHHVLADHFRQRLPNAVSLESVQARDECVESRAPEHAVESSQLFEAIDALHPAEQACVVLWSRGVSHKEIGRRLGLSYFTVSAYLSRAKKRLRQMFGVVIRRIDRR